MAVLLHSLCRAPDSDQMLRGQIHIAIPLVRESNLGRHRCGVPLATFDCLQKLTEGGRAQEAAPRLQPVQPRPGHNRSQQKVKLNNTCTYFSSAGSSEITGGHSQKDNQPDCAFLLTKNKRIQIRQPAF